MSLPGRVYTAERVDRTVRLGAFLLVLSAALSLLLTQRMYLPVFILLAALAVAWFWQQRGGWGSFWEIASFGYLIFFIADLFRISGALAPALVHLFTFILVNKVFNLNRQRDYYQLYLLTFLTVLAATSISVEIEMFYILLLYIVLLVWNIASLTLYTEWEQSQETYFPISLFSPWYLLGVFTATAVTFAIALGIFFIMPRMQLGFLGNLRQEKIQYVSGFSQKVDLGDINSIQADPDVAMRVRVTGGNGSTLPGLKYWRGIGFDHYDGKSWSATIPGSRFLFKDSSSYFYASQHLGNPDSLLHQEFYMEPIDTRVIFGLDRVVRLHGSFGQISRDVNGTLTGMSRPATYEVWSRSSSPTLDELKHAPDDIPESIRRYYLQLPFRSRRIENLALQVTTTQKTTIERALALRNYLQRNYAYSTTRLQDQSNDPISEFLFVRKSGHCEYFASSYVIALRHIGIPARLVNGFREGEFNTIGGFYVVRNSDAHSWTEAFIGGQWVTLDPSPMGTEGPGASFLSYLNPRRIFDSISFFWDRYILVYSGQDQLDTLFEIRDRYKEMRGKFRDRFRGADNLPDRMFRFWKESWRPAALILSFAALLIAAIQLWIRNRQRALMSRTPILFYREMLSILERKGYPRPPQSTPAEFVKTIEKETGREGLADLQNLTDLFYRARFGGYILTSSDEVLVRDSLRRLEQW